MHHVLIERIRLAGEPADLFVMTAVARHQYRHDHDAARARSGEACGGILEAVRLRARTHEVAHLDRPTRAHEARNVLDLRVPLRTAAVRDDQRARVLLRTECG